MLQGTVCRFTRNRHARGRVLSLGCGLSFRKSELQKVMKKVATVSPEPPRVVKRQSHRLSRATRCTYLPEWNARGRNQAGRRTASIRCPRARTSERGSATCRGHGANRQRTASGTRSARPRCASRARAASDCPGSFFHSEASLTSPRPVTRGRDRCEPTRVGNGELPLAAGTTCASHSLVRFRVWS